MWWVIGIGGILILGGYLLYKGGYIMINFPLLGSNNPDYSNNPDVGPGGNNPSTGSPDPGSGGNNPSTGSPDPGSSGNSPSGGGGCFVKGTLIATENGPVPIEAIGVGDRIFSFSKGKPTEALARDVEGVTSTTCKELVLMGLRTGEIRCSVRQAFFSEGRWVRASELRPGKTILNRAGGYDEIVHIRREPNDLPVFHLHLNMYYVTRKRDDGDGPHTREEGDNPTVKHED